MNLKRFVYYWYNETLRKPAQMRALSAQVFSQVESASSLVEKASHYTLHGFNGQWLRTAYLLWLYRELNCTSFLETGTRYGYTSITAQRLLGGPVYSVELMRDNYLHAALLARLVLGFNQQPHLHLGDSRKTLREWLSSALPGKCPMIYLDAHFYEDHPLAEEVRLAVQRGNCVVVIDDFQVPHDAGFGWDNKQGVSVDFKAIEKEVPPDRVRVLYPAYQSQIETGGKRGACILLIDLALPTKNPLQFPENLFSEQRPML
jgi:predicted O-methyltransferase YrrM